MAKELKRITYVEDEPDIRAIAELALGVVGGFELDICENGAEAIAKAPTFAHDLILLDVMMPGMDGIETYQSLRRSPSLSRTPVVFMTAKALTHEVQRYRTLGAAGVIPKPFDPITLAHDVRSIWERVLSEEATAKCKSN